MNSSATSTGHTLLLPSKQTMLHHVDSPTFQSPSSPTPPAALSDLDSTTSSATPYTSTSLALQQLSHWLVSAQQLARTFRNLQQQQQQQPAPSNSHTAFTQQLNKLFTQTNDQFRAFILQEYRTPSSPLHEHWNLLSSQRAFVRQVASDKCQQIQQQIMGLNQIKMCLTAQLSKLVAELKQQVDSVKNVDDPLNTSNSSTAKVLPIAVQQLHGKCMAIHKDIQVLDTELTNSSKQLNELQTWMQEQEGGSTSEEEIQKRQEKEQRMKHELQQSKLAAVASPTMHAALTSPLHYSRHSATSSRFSTPGSNHNLGRNHPSTPSSVTSRSSSISSASSVSSVAMSERSASNFSSNGSSPLSPQQHDERQHDMQPLLFSPIMPHSNPHSPASSIGTPAVTANQHALFTPSNNSPADAADVSAREQPVLDVSSLDMLFEKIWSGSPSQRALEQSNTPVKPVSQNEKTLTPPPSSTFSIVITPASESPMQATASQVDDLLPAVEPPQSSSEYYLQRAKEIAEQMSSPSPMQHSPQQETTSPPASMAPVASAIDPITPSSLISMNATSPFEERLTPIQFQSPSSASKHLAHLNGMHMTPQQLAELDAPFGSNSPPLKPKTFAQQEMSPQKMSPLAQLQLLQRAKAQRHAWMKQMAEENADESKLYDEDDNDADSDNSMSSDSALNESSASTASILNEFIHASPLSQRSMASTPVKGTPTRPSLQSLLQRMTPQRSAKKHPQPESPQQQPQQQPQQHQQERLAVAEPESTTTSSRGWSASFSMGSNQQFRALVSNLQSIAAASSFDSPTPAPPSFEILSRSAIATSLAPPLPISVNFTSPHRASTMQLLKKVQSLNRHSQEELSQQQQPQTVLSPVNTNTSRTREWFEIDAEVLVLSPEAANDSASYSEWNKENSSPEDESVAFGSESEEDVNDVSTESTASIPASPLRYSVFRPTVVIKKVTAVAKDEEGEEVCPTADQPANVSATKEEAPITSRRKPKPLLKSASKPAPVVVPTRASLLAAKAAANKSNPVPAKTQSQKKKAAPQPTAVSNVPIIHPLSLQM